jgi:lipoyl(octanoyl) transferase
MAVDQALVDLVTHPVLRLYRWESPTLTLGYFQATTDREQHWESRDCPLLRRSTGGGAIMHDIELTYSLILPPAFVPTKTSELYDRVHQTVANILAEVGLTALLHPQRPIAQEPIAQELIAQEPFVGERNPIEPPKLGSNQVREDSNSAGVSNVESTFRSSQRSIRQEPFLCFQRRAAGDLILWPTAPTTGDAAVDTVFGHKILGSAQRKRDGAVLQHGSILFQRSSKAPQLFGINDYLALDHQYDLVDFGQKLADRLLAQFGWSGAPSHLTEQETAQARAYQEFRFSHPTWTTMR